MWAKIKRAISYEKEHPLIRPTLQLDFFKKSTKVFNLQKCLNVGSLMQKKVDFFPLNHRNLHL